MIKRNRSRLSSTHSTHQSIWHNKLKTLSPQDRPRERLINEGSNSLDHAELIAIILGTGQRHHTDALELARHILSTLGSFHNFIHSSLEQLLMIKGLGPAKASRLLAVTELIKRSLTQPQASGSSQNQLFTFNADEFLAQMIRQHNHHHLPLLLACQLPELSHDDVNQAKDLIEEAIDQSVTLSLSSQLGDLQQHGRWLAKLLVNNEDCAWSLLSYRESESLLKSEEDGLAHLLELALAMGLTIDRVFIVSPERHWLIFQDHQDEV